MEIEGKIAVVTGAAAGTGRVIARRLAREGAVVVVADIDVPGGEETAGVIRSRAGRASFVRADVRVDEEVRALVESVDAGQGGLQILVNNAGGGGHVEPHFPEADPEDWRATLDLNLRGAMLATQLALGPMQRAGGGAVVNIASTAGLGFARYHSPEYAAAKAGLIRFSTTLGHLRERMNVRVNCVVPDWIETERAREELARMTAEERASRPTPLPPETVADAVVELIRDDELAARVVVLEGGEPRRLLDTE
jgi:NAD(P)-dependent dehydrogenase (short-subunit alcohol dehydrogenase family)